jgi:4-amino-4-deoxy-L-arabinose transferase-like glycosyltransferase
MPVSAALPRRHFILTALAILGILKLVFLFGAMPYPDEAYYWMWGQYPALSYFDHPPLIAWTQRATAELLGWNRFALRAATLLTFSVSLGVVVHWAGRLAGPASPDAAPAAALVLLASPLFFVFQTITFPDHLLIALSLLAAHLFMLFVTGTHEGKTRLGCLYGAALAVGLAGLAKYNAVFVGLGFAGWFLLDRRGRAALRTPHPWIAGVIAMAAVSPVIIWNLQHGWPSFQYHMRDRIGPDASNAVSNLAAFLAASGVMFSLFLVPALYRFLFLPAANPVARQFQLPGRTAFWASSTVFLSLATVTFVQFYWNTTSVLFLMPVLIAFFARPWELKGHAISGIVLAAVLTFSYTAIPVTALLGVPQRDIDMTYGWPEIAAAVARAEGEHKPDRLLAGDYRIAALLGFEMKRRDVASISRFRDQYDFWDGAPLPSAASALVLDDVYSPVHVLPEIRSRKFTVLGNIAVTRFGIEIHRFRLIYIPPDA